MDRWNNRELKTHLDIFFDERQFIRKFILNGIYGCFKSSASELFIKFSGLNANSVAVKRG